MEFQWACYSRVLGDVFYSSDTHKCKNGVCWVLGEEKEDSLIDCGRRVPT